MTAASTIDEVWRTSIWGRSEVVSVTPKIYQYDITQDSESELGSLAYNGKVAAWVQTTLRTQNYIGVNLSDQRFTVQIDLYKEKDPTGEAWVAVRDAFEALDDLVQSALGDTWAGSVAFWERQRDPIEITEITIGGAPCWRGRFNYYAVAY